MCETEVNHNVLHVFTVSTSACSIQEIKKGANYKASLFKLLSNFEGTKVIEKHMHVHTYTQAKIIHTHTDTPTISWLPAHIDYLYNKD